MTAIPILNSYWVIPGRFLGGEYPRNQDHESSVAKLQALTAAGIFVFIDLTTTADGLSPYREMLQTIAPQAECLSFQVPDVSVPDKRETAIAAR